MKNSTFILAAVLTLSGCATAPGTEWVAPAVIGGIVGYTISQSQQPPAVVIKAEPILIHKHYGSHPHHHGTVWREEWRFDPRCNCKKLYLVQIR